MLKVSVIKTLRTSSGTLEIPKETGHGIWKSPHKLQFSPDGLDSWCVSLFTVVLVVVLDSGGYMRYNCVFQICNRPFLRQTLEKVNTRLQNMFTALHNLSLATRTICVFCSRLVRCKQFRIVLGEEQGSLRLSKNCSE